MRAATLPRVGWVVSGMCVCLQGIVRGRGWVLLLQFKQNTLYTRAHLCILLWDTWAFSLRAEGRGLFSPCCDSEGTWRLSRVHSWLCCCRRGVQIGRGLLLLAPLSCLYVFHGSTALCACLMHISPDAWHAQVWDWVWGLSRVDGMVVVVAFR